VGRAPAQGRVRPVVIVVSAPVGHDSLGVSEPQEPVLIQTLVPKPPVETFDEAILRWLARLDEIQPDTVLVGPLIQRPADELGAVVGAKQRWLAQFPRQPVHHPHDARARQRRIELDRQALPTVIVHHPQHPYHPPVRQRVADKIHRPVLARRRRPGQRLPHPRRVPFSLAATQRQPLLPIQAQHPLVVHLPPLPAQQQVQPLIPEPPPFRRQLQQALLEPRCRFRLGPVALTRSMGRDHPAGPPLTQLQLLGEQPHGCPPGIGPQSFFDSTSRSPFTSSISSATRCFSSRFSSSSCRSRFASLTSRPPYFAFQRYSVCSLTPSRRQASFGLPPASTSFNTPMICSSVNLLARAGVESVPLVVQEVAHPAVELPDILGDLPRDYVFAADDPPTVGDFLEEALTCILTLPAT